MNRIALTTLLATLFLTGCGRELWVYAPTDSLEIEVAEGTAVVAGEAVITYDPTVLPRNEISDALRITVEGEVVELRYPGVGDEELRSFHEEPHKLNRLNVFEDCNEPVCTTVVPFEIHRFERGASRLVISADAISTTPQREHLKLMELIEDGPTSWPSDRATLELIQF